MKTTDGENLLEKRPDEWEDGERLACFSWNLRLFMTASEAGK